MNKVPLSEIADITPGFAFKSSQFGPTGHKVVKIKDITPPFVETANSDCVVMDAEESQKLKKFRISRGDFVVAMTGATIGKVGIYVDEGVAYINQRVAKIDAKGDNDKSFIYYCLCSESFIKFIFSNLDSSSAQGNISADGIGRYTVSDVAFSTQRKIASILSALDDKIELNHKINAELEHTARLIYDYWFTQFDFPDAQGKPYKSSAGSMVYNDQLKREIPAGWSVKSLFDIATFTNGIPAQKYYANNDEPSLPIIKIREISNGISPNTEYATKNVPSKVLVQNGDVLFSWSATLEVKLWSGGNGVLNQHIFKVTSDKYPKSFYFFQLLDYLQHFKMLAENRKTTMGHITKDHLIQSKIAIPNDGVAQKFHELVAPMIDSVVKRDEESRELAQLRDWLLPMLMTGQVKVV